jgi:hypothetical protein
MINFLIKIFLIIFIQLFPVNSFADSIDNDMANTYAEFIDLLNQNIIGIKKGRFCIFGSDEISNAISLRNKDYLKIEEDMKNVELCNLVYIANDRQKSFKFIGKKFTDNKIVTIANYSGFANNDNGLIEIQLGRRNFELIINKKSLRANGLKLNPLIHSLVIN